MRIFFTVLMLLLAMDAQAATAYKALGNVNVDDFIMKKGPTIDVRAFANLSAAKASPQTAGKSIVISTSQSINNATIASNRALIVVNGGSINVASGKTLTVNGGFSGGANQIFTGAGAVEGLKNVDHLAWFGVKGDGATDDTAALNKAISATPSGGRLRIPAGTYRISADSATAYAAGGLLINKPFHLSLDKGAIIKSLTGATDNSYIVRIVSTSNVEISGGTFIGDRTTTANTGEWGHGIATLDSTNVTIRDLTVEDVKGDGLYFGGYSAQNENILIENVNISRYRRWGIGWVNGRNGIIRNVVIRDQTSVPALAFGGAIDMEDHNGFPDFSNIIIDKCKFIDNKNIQGAITIQGINADSKFQDSKITNSYFSGNTTDINAGYELLKNLTIQSNTFVGTTGVSTTARGNTTAGSVAENIKILDNSYRTIGGSAIQLGGDADETIRNIRIVSNDLNGVGFSGIVTSLGTFTDIGVKNNTISSGLYWPVNVEADADLVISGNRLKASKTPVLSITGSGTKVTDNTIISEGGNDGISISGANAMVGANRISGAIRYSIHLPVAGTGSVIADNLVDGTSNTTTNIVYAPAPTGAKSYFLNNVVYKKGVGSTAYLIDAGHVTANNQSP